jgi:putative transposase
MKRSRYTEPEIIRIIEKYKSGRTIAELCKEYGISTSTFYAWKVWFGSGSQTEVSTLQRLRKENRRLRRRIAEMTGETDKLKGRLRSNQSDCIL